MVGNYLAKHSDFSLTMSSEADKIAQFQSITGATEPIARSILEAANWNLEVVLKYRSVLTL